VINFIVVVVCVMCLVIYLVGLALVTITAQNGLTYVNEPYIIYDIDMRFDEDMDGWMLVEYSNVPLFFIALYTVALGTGGIKPNVSTFGADQFSNSAADKAQKETFFVWHAWHSHITFV
jgi:dipeptide/tripeptide permease